MAWALKCSKCSSDRVARINAKCSDCCSVSYKKRETDGYVPSGLGVGEGGDYIEIDLCLQCGTIQGVEFPLPEPEPFDNEEDSNDCDEECGGCGEPCYVDCGCDEGDTNLD